MARFKLAYKDELSDYDDPNEILDHWQADDAQFLVDTEEKIVLLCDYCEPEDAYLYRHYSKLVDIMNELAAK